MKKFRRDMIRSISESRKATREEISQIHSIKECLYKLGIQQNNHNTLIDEILPYLRGKTGDYHLEKDGCHPMILLSGIYDYLQLIDN